MKVIKTVAHLRHNSCRGLNRIAKYQWSCNSHMSAVYTSNDTSKPSTFVETLLSIAKYQYVDVNRDTTS
jgi:hypothetical protein